MNEERLVLGETMRLRDWEAQDTRHKTQDLEIGRCKTLREFKHEDSKARRRIRLERGRREKRQEKRHETERHETGGGQIASLRSQ